MVTAKFVSAKSAKKYYTSADYYEKESENGNQEFYGKGAELFNIQGKLDYEAFAKLLDGKHPITDEALKEQENSDRAALDLTYTVPKSAAVAALAYGDDRIVELMEKSVKKGLDYLQDQLVQTRVGGHDKRVLEHTENIVAALFTHKTY